MVDLTIRIYDPQISLLHNQAAKAKNNTSSSIQNHNL